MVGKPVSSREGKRVLVQQLTEKERSIREALTELRRRGLRNFSKYPVEPWEPPLTEAEKRTSREICGLRRIDIPSWLQ